MSQRVYAKRAKIQFLSSCLLISCLSMGSTMAAEIKNTCGVQAKWITSSLQKHLLSIKHAGDKAEIQSDGQYLKVNETARTFYLSPGEKLEYKDRHSAIQVLLLETTAGSLKFKYEFRADKRSSGQNEIAVDSGEVTIATRD